MLVLGVQNQSNLYIYLSFLHSLPIHAITEYWAACTISKGSASSVSQSCPTLCDPMNRSTPGLPVHHQLPEFTQTRVHWVGDAIQPSHPMSSPFPPAPNPSQHQGLFQWVSSSHKVAEVLEFQLLASVFPMNTQDWSPLGLGLDFFYFVSGTKKKKKKAPIFWWELPSNFQIVEVQCWLPFISQDVWAKISTDDSNGKHASKRSPLVLLVLEVQ